MNLILNFKDISSYSKYFTTFFAGVFIISGLIYGWIAIYADILTYAPVIIVMAIIDIATAYFGYNLTLKAITSNQSVNFGTDFIPVLNTEISDFDKKGIKQSLLSTAFNACALGSYSVFMYSSVATNSFILPVLVLVVWFVALGASWGALYLYIVDAVEHLENNNTERLSALFG